MDNCRLPSNNRIIESGVLDGKSVELLEGEIVTMSPESPLHTTINYSVANYSHFN